MASPGFRESIIRFKGMLMQIACKLSPEDIRGLGFMYLDKEDVQTGTELMDRLSKRRKIRDCQEDLNGLIESLEDVGRTDLKEIVTEYIEKESPPFKWPERPPSLEPVVKEASLVSSTNLHMGMEERDGDLNKSTISINKSIVGIGNLKRQPDIGNYETNIAKKRRTKETTAEEQRDLEEAAKLFTVCDSTDDSDGAGPDDETTEDDDRFMKEAKAMAMNSPDQQTKVGAVIVNPVTKKIVARGCNRMPKGCEEQFNWVRDKEMEPFEHGKHYYVVYAVRAAIFDGYKNGADLRGCVLYTTLYPSNVCAQCIRDAEIAEVVYVSDKFHDAKFMEAARRIMEGIKCRQMQ